MDTIIELFDNNINDNNEKVEDDDNDYGDNNNNDDDNDNQEKNMMITSKDINQLLNENKQDSYRSMNNNDDRISFIDQSLSSTEIIMNMNDTEQFEKDKKAVYSHPLFPLLALLFEKCELATQSITLFETDSNLATFNREIEDFIDHHHRTLGTNSSFFTNNPEVDSLMLKAIQVFRIHLLELEKVSQLCQDFCQRYISCLRSKMRSDNLIRSGGDDEFDMDIEPMDNDDDDDDDRENLAMEDELSCASSSFFPSTTIPNETLFCSNPSPSSSISSSSSSNSYLSQHHSLQILTSSSSSSSPSSSLHQPSPSLSLSISSQKSNPSSSLNSILFNGGQKSIPITPNNAPIMFSGLSNPLVFNFDSIMSTSPSTFLKSMSKCIQQQQQQPHSPQEKPISISNNCDSNSNSNDDDDGDDDMVHDLSLKSKLINTESIDINDDNNLNKKEEELPSNPSMLDDNQLKSKKVKKEKQTKSKKFSNDKQSGTTNMNNNNNCKRGVLPKHATSIMRLWLFQHIVHPYPTEDEKRTIASETNLTLLQVNNWFINARRRILQPMLDSANNGRTKSISDSSSSNDPGLDLTITATKKTNRKNLTNISKTKSKTKSQPQQQSINNRFWPQSLANIIQTNDVKQPQL
ncbi:Homeobox protein pknox2 [Dermatophagoides pteronyssinus]|uniref:Homeobox protein pknox2 n=1 Tax=Dermatophagoides pteronyssinus TaxID=6956 RepID=A0ABQ8J7N4_DERPT|nr:Homeobox protein pknox2 [Dermatophagoides pteronyssinus]